MEQYVSVRGLIGAFSVDEGTLAQLCKIVREFVGGEPQLGANMDDDHSVAATDLSSLIDSHLVKTRQLQSITITKASEERSLSIELKRAASPVVIRIVGPTDPSLKARNEIEDILRAKRPWYHWIAPSPDHLPTFLGNIVFFVLASLAIYYVSYRLFGKPDGSNRATLISIAFAATFLFGFLASFVKSIAFPRMIFEIGVSRNRGDTARTTRGIVWLAISTVVLGVFVFWLTEGP